MKGDDELKAGTPKTLPVACDNLTYYNPDDKVQSAQHENILSSSDSRTPHLSSPHSSQRQEKESGSADAAIFTLFTVGMLLVLAATVTVVLLSLERAFRTNNSEAATTIFGTHPATGARDTGQMSRRPIDDGERR